jgi:Holliday junction resolvase RusA-like endonuclease
MRITFEVPGEPQGKQRARAVSIGRFARLHPDEKSVKYETFIKEMFCVAHPGFTPLDAPLSLCVLALLSIPKSVSAKRRAQMLSGEILPGKKPDFDNVLKAVADALNTIAWRDDSLVVDATFRKRFSDRPRLVVDIYDGRLAPQKGD